MQRYAVDSRTSIEITRLTILWLSHFLSVDLRKPHGLDRDKTLYYMIGFYVCNTYVYQIFAGLYIHTELYRHRLKHTYNFVL